MILKHNNPCGAAHGQTLAEAYFRANRADRIAAFGGCLVLNRPLDKDTAELAAQNYLEVLAAPDFEEGALDIVKKRANLRIIQVRRMDRLSEYRDLRFVDFKSLMDGGLIVQQSALCAVKGPQDLKLAETVHEGKTYRIQRAPTQKEMEDLLFGWYVEQGVTSNSVLYVKDLCTVAIGTGEQDRVGVAELAVYRPTATTGTRCASKSTGCPTKNWSGPWKRAGGPGKTGKPSMRPCGKCAPAWWAPPWFPTPSSPFGMAWMWAFARESPRWSNPEDPSGIGKSSKPAMKRA